MFLLRRRPAFRPSRSWGASLRSRRSSLPRGRSGQGWRRGQPTVPTARSRRGIRPGKTRGPSRRLSRTIRTGPLTIGSVLDRSTLPLKIRVEPHRSPVILRAPLTPITQRMRGQMLATMPTRSTDGATRRIWTSSAKPLRAPIRSVQATPGKLQPTGAGPLLSTRMPPRRPGAVGADAGADRARLHRATGRAPLVFGSTKR